MTIARACRACFAFSVALTAVAAPTLGALPKVPEGFTVRLVAAVPAVTYPCQIATAPDGSLFVAEDPMDQVGPYEADHGRILLFREGKDPVVFAEGFRAIFGMAWHDGALYVMHMPRMTALRDTNGDGRADQKKELFKDLGPGPRALNDHIVSGLQFGMDGWLYISVGDKGVPGVHGPDGRYAQLHGGGTMRCRPDGTEIEVISTGTRNHLEPNLDAHDNIFTYDNTDDGLGWWTRVTHHIDGGYLGYPFDYLGRPDRHLPRMAEYGGGSPCGGLVYKEDAWPEEYRGRAFWAEWGKRHVAAVKFAPDGSTFKVVDYLKFVEPAEGESMNPLDLALSYDGKTLYVADWGMGGWGSKTEKVGRIYAVTYTRKIETQPRGTDADPIPAQIRALSHPSYNERMRGQAALIKKGKDAIPSVTAALSDPATEPVARRHLIWTLDALAGGTAEATSPMLSALKSPSADVRAQAARALGLRRVTEAVEPLILTVNDPDPAVRLQAIISLGRIKAARAIPAILPVVADRDAYLAFSARVALQRIHDWKATASGVSPSTDSKIRLGVLAALEQQYDRDAVDLLQSVITDRRRPVDERAKALFILAQAHRKTPPWNGSWWGTRPAQGKPPAKTIAWEGTGPITETVHEALTDAEAPIRLTAVVAIRDMDDRQSLAKLRERFAVEPETNVRREIATTLGTMDDKAAVPLLIAELRDPKAPEVVREAALSSLEKIGTDATIQALVDLLGEPDLKPDRQARVVATLGRFQAKAALPAIVKALSSIDAKVRASAAEAIGLIGDTSAAPKVSPLLKDQSPEVRKAAITAVGLLKDRESIPALIACANDEATRFEATIALAAIPEARALQVYLQGLTDTSQEVRKASARAILTIRDQALPILEQLARRNELPPSTLPELRKVFASIQPVMNWQIVGTFKGNERPPFRPVAPIDVKKPVILPGGKRLEWKSTTAIDPQGQVDLTKLFKETGDRSVFGYAEINAPAARAARIAVGSDDTLLVWLNGRPVYKFETDRGFAPEQDSVDVNLVKGMNRLLIRCGNTGGEWAFSVGITTMTTEYAFLKGATEGGIDPNQFRAAAMRGIGKAEHGKALFNDLKGLACIKCHAVGGKGALIGPELSAVGLKYPREEIITSVLYPSQKISSGYESVVIATVDGKVLTGIIKSESADTIEIEDVEAKRIKVAKAQIDGRKTSDVSLMPNDLAEGLSPSDFADLIAYLESLKDTAALHAPAGATAKPE